MQWVIDAYEEVLDEARELDIVYSRRFKDYNASVRYKPGWMQFRLSAAWKTVDTDIQKGVVQHLACKALKLDADTVHLRLYQRYLQTVGERREPEDSPRELVERFEALNEEYFDGALSQPTLEWGSFSTTRLGSYHYATDTIRLSTALKDAPELLDYVLYHELLHKKHKFSCKNGRTRHHTPAFREDEALFSLEDAEERLAAFVREKKRLKRTEGIKERFWPW